LAPVKEVAQIGACIGREFDHELLGAVVSMPEAELLLRLIAWLPQSSFPARLPPAATYVFKHALVRDAAYESLLKRRRQSFTRISPLRLRLGFPTCRGQPELVARHFGEADWQRKQFHTG
jgi:hypothetical protein